MNGDRTIPSRDTQQERLAELREEYGELYMDLLTLLFESDPIGINFGVNRTEYGPELSKIWPQLPAIGSQDELRNLLHATMVEMFSERMAGSMERYDGLAREMWLTIEQRRDELMSS